MSLLNDLLINEEEEQAKYEEVEQLRNELRTLVCDGVITTDEYFEMVKGL